MNKYYAIYTKERDIVICNLKRKNAPKSKLYRQFANNINPALTVKVLKNKVTLEKYLLRLNKNPYQVFEIVPVDENGTII